MSGRTAGLDLPPWDVDEDLVAATLAGGGPRVRAVRWARTEVVVGRGGDPEAEVDLDAASTAGVPVRRRRGGGCAVLLDPGNCVVSLTAPADGVGGVTTAFRLATAWLVAGLAACGVPGVAGAGTSDLVLGDRKVGGSCLYRTRGLVYYSSTLLLAPDLALMERLLPHPPREPGYRRGRGHREFLGNLAPPDGESPEAWIDGLLGVLSAAPPRF